MFGHWYVLYDMFWFIVLPTHYPHITSCAYVILHHNTCITYLVALCNGVASITVTAGDTAGAGIITASYIVGEETFSDTFGFTSDGSQTGDSSGTVSLGLSIVDSSGLPFSSDNPVSKNNKGTVTATLLDESTPIAGQLISFTTNFTGKITPVLGTALTDENGQANVTLSSGDSKGAGQVIAT